MRYLGGKTRLAKDISGAMLAATDDRTRFIDPFVGGGSIMNSMVPHFGETYISDIHLDLVMLYQKIADEGIDWIPEEVTEETWRSFRKAEPSALRGFIGFGCSFGGRWFEGYARGGNTNYAAQSKRSLAKHLETWQQVTEISCKSYTDIKVLRGDIIYLDPPYVNTKSYSGTDKFNTDEFWDNARMWADQGAHVFVSEYTAPDGWTSIWSKEKKVTMDSLYTASSIEKEREVKKDIEHLFTIA